MKFIVKQTNTNLLTNFHPSSLNHFICVCREPKKDSKKVTFNNNDNNKIVYFLHTLHHTVRNITAS